MILRWLVKHDGSRVLQAQQRKKDSLYTSILVWVDIPEVREPEKDPIMTDQENSA